jgi:hypothetical protein
MPDIVRVDAVDAGYSDWDMSARSVHSVTWAPVSPAVGLIVVAIEWDILAVTVVSVTDDAGNTYHEAGDPVPGVGHSHVSVHTYYAYNCPALTGAHTVTVTLSDLATFRFTVEIYANADSTDPYVMSDGHAAVVYMPYTFEAGTAVPVADGSLILAAITYRSAPV